jgi:hypothetical protein
LEIFSEFPPCGLDLFHDPHLQFDLHVALFVLELCPEEGVVVLSVFVGVVGVVLPDFFHGLFCQLFYYHIFILGWLGCVLKVIVVVGCGVFLEHGVDFRA